MLGMQLRKKSSVRARVKVFLFFGIMALLWFTARFSSGFAGDATHYVSRPFRVVWGYGYTGFRSVHGFFASRESLQRDVAKFNEENAKLRQSLAELEMLQTENEGLRQALGNKELVSSASPVAARVIGKGAHVFGQTLLVDQGSSVGIQEGDVVVADARMLVGRVSRVTTHHAEVTLLGNRSFRAAVKIVSAEPTTNNQQSTTTLAALARGEGFGNVLLDTIPADATLNGGETILTSGFDGMFPPDLVVGKVGRLLSGPSDFFQRTEIEPVVDIGELETVLILSHLSS